MLSSILRRFKALCREPVLSAPVLILESDDWGPGPASHAEKLQRLFSMLERYKDSEGRSPVMTLGVILAVPHRASGVPTPRQPSCKRLLSEEDFRSLRDLMLFGKAQGVFDLHLHGMEHSWMPAVLKAAETDATIQSWLHAEGCPLWEDLPPALQSRWVDGSVLPSLPLEEEAIRSAVLEETKAFRNIFGFRAQVAVPPTFVWNDAVECAWAEAGIRVIVTPGRRFEMRDAQGKPSGTEMEIVNGRRSRYGPLYLVRDVYFEPARGHSWKRVLEAVKTYQKLGRPVLVEIHRENFIGPKAERSFRELENLLSAVGKSIPTVRYLSTRELALCMAGRDTDLMERRWSRKIRILLRRLWHERRLRVFACFTGLIVPGFLMALFLDAWHLGKNKRREDDGASGHRQVA